MENAHHVINTSMATNAMEGGYGGLDTSMDRNILLLQKKGEAGKWIRPWMKINSFCGRRGRLDTSMDENILLKQ